MAFCFLAFFLTFAPEFRKFSFAPLKLVHNDEVADASERLVQSNDVNDVIA